MAIGAPAAKNKKKKDRSFRRLDERVGNTAPMAIAWIGGVSLGALSGLAFGLIECAVLEGGGVPTAARPHLLPLIAGYLGLGAGLGWIAGSTGLWGPRWVSASTITWAAFLVSSRAATWMVESGLPGVLGLAVAMISGIALGQVVGRLPGPTWVHQGAAAFVWVAMALLAPLHHHVLASSVTGGAVLASLVGLGVAALAATVAALMAGEGRAPVIPLVVAAAIGGGLSWYSLRDPPPRVPVSRAEQGPVVLVAISGLRADRTGFGGHTRAHTPTLDRFAQDGVTFTAAHATSNWTVPSLASALTGRLPYAHGAGLHNGSANKHTPLRADQRTLAGVLHNNGWATAAVVADPDLRTYQLDQGFDVWIDDPERGALPAGLRPFAAAGVDASRWPRSSSAERVTDRAIAWVASAPPQGWLLLVQYGDAGGPFLPAPEDVNEVGFTTRGGSADVYDAAVRRVDRNLARLLESLPANATVIVFGDRGVQLGEDRPLGVSGRADARFGHTMYEELLRVPLAVRSPGVETRVQPAAVSLVDLAPWVWQHAGVTDPPTTDGEPIVLRDEQPERVLVAQSTLFGSEQQMVILGRHKLIDTAEKRTPLFDLVADPSEVNPLPTQSETDLLERKLLAVLPPPGSGVSLNPAPSLLLQFGQIASRYLEPLAPAPAP